LKNQRVIINCGDPNGIGPEVTVKALLNLPKHLQKRVILIGCPQQVEEISRSLGEPRTFVRVKSVTDAFDEDTFPVICPPGADNFTVAYGSISETSGRISAQGIEMGVKSCLGGETEALVTAPSSKKALHLAGYRYPGQTEMIAELTDSEKFIMILLAGEKRVGMITTHLALRDVGASLSRLLIKDKIVLFRATLTVWFGVDNPRIAVAALNPHASDGGIFGDEENRFIKPAVEDAKRNGVEVVGPVPADTLFPRWDRFDGILAIYHDQGMIPIKMIGFGRAVNVTGGLPFPRTSPDHGTAFDIAGKMTADPTSMTNAVLTAFEIVDRLKKA
jgi:4-hydroxythreonine-4-phosphate dehydrogenase